MMYTIIIRHHPSHPRKVEGADPVITIQGVVLNVVKEFKYLGGTETNDASMSREIAIRCQKMQVAYNTLRLSVYECKNITLKTKLCMFKSCVVTAGVYGCAVWNTSADDMKKIESCQFRLLRALYGWTWRQFHSYEDILIISEAVGVLILPIEVVIREARLKYLGHVERMEDDRDPKSILYGAAFNGGRESGGQELTFRGVLKRDLQKAGIDPKAWQELARDRDKWRIAVTVKGRKEQLKGWYEARRVKSVKAHSKPRSAEAKAYREASEKRGRCDKVQAEALKFDAVSRAVKGGSVVVRRKKQTGEELVTGKMAKGSRTGVNLIVAKLLGYGDTFKDGDGMVTALEKAGDETGTRVEGVVQWKTKALDGTAGGMKQTRRRVRSVFEEVFEMRKEGIQEEQQQIPLSTEARELEELLRGNDLY